MYHVERGNSLGYNVGTNRAFSPKGTKQMANQTGKRYFCEKCGSEFIVTKGGDGAVNCCSQPMVQK